jgi:hypothetical protein
MTTVMKTSVAVTLLLIFNLAPLYAQTDLATDSVVLRAMSRMLLNPARATANVALVQAPWYRADRPLRHIVVP